MTVPTRRSVRLSSHDYRNPGPYFLTVCAFQKACIFGFIRSNEVHLNSIGRIVNDEWLRTPSVRPEVTLDEFVVMPNHLHAIINLGEGAAFNEEPCIAPGRQPRSLGSLVAGFKAACTVRINSNRMTPGRAIWQKNYYEHVIRSDDDLRKVQEYIRGNPARWNDRL